MITYRQTTVPVIYTKLKFMRASWPSILADCPDDLPLLQQIQSVAAGHACVSKLERSYQLIVKAEFPDDILERNGSSNEVIEWRSYYWKLYDAQSLVTDRDPPAEAIHIDKAGINTQFLDSLAHPKSCLPMLRATQNVVR